MSYLKDNIYTHQVRSSYLPLSVTEPFYRYNLLNNCWLGKEYVKITFDHEKVEAEIEEIRELLRNSPRFSIFVIK